MEPNAWPMTAVRRDGRALGVLLAAIAAVWIGVPLRFLWFGAGEPIPGLGRAGAALALLVGLGFALWALEGLVRRQSLVIDDHAVRSCTRSLVGVRAWSAPRASYRGVVCRSQPVRSRRGGVLHLIELWHDDPARRVVLFSSRDGAAAEACWRFIASRLRLPALGGPPAAAVPAEAEVAAGRITVHKPGRARAADERQAGRRVSSA